MSLSVPQIAAQLDAVLASKQIALVVAMRADIRQEWPATITQLGRQFSLRWCESMLAMREALCDAEQLDPATAGMIVLTPLGTNAIAEDILARLARARVFESKGWVIVQQMFGAKEVDARLGRLAWMPQALVDAAAQGDYAPVPSGFLDLETAWKELLLRFLQMDVARPDAAALLEWTMKEGADGLLNLLPAQARPDALRWLGESSGVAGRMVLACVEAGRTGDALALGLVCGVLYCTQAEGNAALAHATIRLERFVNDVHVGVGEGRAWAGAARQLLAPVDAPEQYRSALDRADALLKELRVSEFAHLSDVLPTGFDQRMRSFATALAAHAQSATQATLQVVEESAGRALAHVFASTQPQRADRIAMARRLARWLVRPPNPGTSVSAVVRWQASEGAFVDWARFRLLGGDELVEVSHAYEALRSAVAARRNAMARPFGLALQRWNAQAPVADESTVPLEAVLDQVVAPLAARHPVLLLVVDGLSTSIFRELFARIERLGWEEMVRASAPLPLAGIAALPTVTEVSRATLLCGKLTTGGSSHEKAGFAAHPALLAQSSKDHKPRLFHKGELSDSTNLSGEVRAAIANARQKVVGIVYNAIDDHLSGPDQLNQRWSLDDLRLLLPILREARDARRVVIVTADHGHLLEDGTALVVGGDSDRWRPGDTALNDNEIVFSGGRVRTASGAKAVACLWSESARYAGRKNGYHGGVSPQEVTVPLSVFVPSRLALAGWQSAAPPQPEWWDLPDIAAAMPMPMQPVVARAAPPRRASKAPVGQEQLFDVDALPVLAAATAQDWIGALLQSDVFAAQRALAARVAPPDETTHKLLTALSERGGKLSRTALAQRLAMPEVRLNGLLSAMRRILNVDQASVLVVDDGAGTVELNRNLLFQQFRIVMNGNAQ